MILKDWGGRDFLYMYNFNEIVGVYTLKHIIRKHKEQATAWYQNYRHWMKDNKVMRS